MKNKIQLLALFICLLSQYAHANDAIHNKSRAGVFYNIGFLPKVAQLSDPDNQVNLIGFHYAGFGVEIPYNKYLAFGFSLDFAVPISPIQVPGFFSPALSNVMPIMIGMSGLIKPQLPIPVPWGNLMAYAAFEGGFGGTPALTFGTEPLARNLDHQMTRDMPSVFPLFFNTAATIGLEYYIFSLIGFQVGAGYRTLWVLHPTTSKQFSAPNSKPLEKRLLWYDVQSIVLSASIKMAF